MQKKTNNLKVLCIFQKMNEEKKWKEGFVRRTNKMQEKEVKDGNTN